MKPLLLLLTLSLATLIPPLALAGDKTPSTEDQIKGLQSMCEDSADARAARHLEKSLYERLGGYDRIHALTTEVIRLHDINPAIKHTMVGVDHEVLAKHLTDFVAAGTGGTANYSGRDLPSSHAHLELTDADFLSAGGDIVTAMKSMDYGQNEIDEFLCILMSLKDQVVFK